MEIAIATCKHKQANNSDVLRVMMLCWIKCLWLNVERRVRSGFILWFTENAMLVIYLNSVLEQIRVTSHFGVQIKPIYIENLKKKTLKKKPFSRPTDPSSRRASMDKQTTFFFFGLSRVHWDFARVCFSFILLYIKFKL